MECEVVDGERMALALGALQGRVQRLQTARKDAVAERTALEARADQLPVQCEPKSFGCKNRFLSGLYRDFLIDHGCCMEAA